MDKSQLTSILFIAITLMTAYWFYTAAHRSKIVALALLGWISIQTFIALNGVYQDLTGTPPNIFKGVAPTLICIIVLFNTPSGRKFIDGLALKSLTYLNVIRIPVEIVLLMLAQLGMIPFLMTFEGTNFDILAGISAPIMAYLYFYKHKISKRGLLIWNIVCLLLLLNIVVTAILCVPSSFQQLAFEQPNIAILQFPYNLLPTVVVPIVIFGHLVSIRRLIKS